MASRLNKNILKKIINIPVISAIAIIFLVITIIKMNNQLSRNSFYALNGTQENYSWAVAKLSMQISQFETMVIRKKYKEKISTEEINTKINILFSRINVLLNESESTLFLYKEKDYKKTIDIINKRLEDIDEELKKTTPNFNKITANTASLHPYIVSLANIADHAEVMQRTDSLNDFLDKRNTLRILLWVTCVLCITLIIITRLKISALRKAISSERKAFDNKNAFLGKVGHELRTSLQTIIGSIDVLSKTPQKVHNNIIKNLESASVQLERQMDDLAEFAKIDNGLIPLHFSIFNLKETLLPVLEKPFLSSYNKSVKIEFNNLPDIFIKTDKFRLIQIIENIYSNSLKYTDSGFIKISINYTSLLEISIKDSGCGIPQDKLPYIFEPFFRTDNSNKNIPGIGMGLAIVDRLVKALNGKINLKSTLDVGTEFNIEIPVEVITKKPTKIIGETVNNSNFKFPDLQILVIDDNELSCSTLSSMLESGGLKSETELYSVRALQKLSRKPYDLIVCDIQMPVFTGYEIIKKIRSENGPNKNKPFIFVSAYAEKNEFMGCKILSKPVRINELLLEIKKNLFT